MPATLADLLGLPANDEDLHINVYVGPKATTGGSKVAPGKWIVLAAGVWSLAGAAPTGELGIVPKKAPLNEDSSPTLQVANKKNTAWYVEAGGTIDPGARVISGANGVTVAGAGPAVYEGHYGEGVGLDNKPTQATTGQAIRVRFL